MPPETATGELSPHYSTPELDDSDIIRRTRIAMTYFTGAIAESKGNRVGTFMRMLTEEMIEESSIVPPDILEFYMRQAAAVLYWTATGENIINMPMPGDFVNGLPKDMRAAILEQKERLAIESDKHE